jgi:hypothetical protein
MLVNWRKPLEWWTLRNPQDRDFAHGGTALLCGFFKHFDQLAKLGLAAPAEIHEGDAKSPVVWRTVADSTEGPKGNRVCADAHVDDRTDFEASQTGHHQQAALGAEVDHSAGHGDIGFKWPRGRFAAEPVTPRLPLVRRSSIAAHLDFFAHVHPGLLAAVYAADYWISHKNRSIGSCSST